MQLRPQPGAGRPRDLADGLATYAIDLGQRPAVTVLGAAGRAEQGFVTLAQWAAKGAHLLLTDCFLGPGDAVLVDLPPGWPLAAVCAGVWWAGGTVITDATHATDDVAVGVVHETRPAPDGVETVYVVGDAVDGGPADGDGGAVGVAVGSWAEEVQVFPDQPPPRAARPDVVALRTGRRAISHAEVVAAATASSSASGTLGLDVGTFRGDAADAITAVAARPLATGRTTLVLTGGLERSAATGDRVRTWL